MAQELVSRGAMASAARAYYSGLPIAEDCVAGEAVVGGDGGPARAFERARLANGRLRNPI